LDITATGWGNREIYGNVATMLAGVPGVDIVAAIGDTTRNSGPLDVTRWDQMILGLADAREQTNTPIAVINTITDVAHDMTDMLAQHNIIHLSGAANAVRAISHAGRYARWRQSHQAFTSPPDIDAQHRPAALCLLPESGSGGMSESASKELLRLY